MPFVYTTVRLSKRGWIGCTLLVHATLAACTGERAPDVVAGVPDEAPATPPASAPPAPRTGDARAEIDCDALEKTDRSRPSVESRSKPAWVDDVGISRDGELMVDGVQCSGTATWAYTDPELARSYGSGNALVSGDRVRIIDNRGVRRARIAVNRSLNEAAVAPRPSSSFALVMHDRQPARGSALEHRRLSSPGEAAGVAAAWLEIRENHSYQAVGELTGTFGGGVDRIVVLAATPLPPPEVEEHEDAEPDWCATEFAVAMAGRAVRGILPLTRDASKESRARCECDLDSPQSISGLEVAAVFDLDGDGIDEVAWVYQFAGGALTTSVDVTYYADGGFGAQSLGSCSYNGCEAFLGPSQCGRSLVKRHPAAELRMP